MTGDAAVFVDRDGVLNVRPPEHAYVSRVEALEWLARAAGGVAALNDAGYRVVVVSNQRGIARGLVTSETLAGIEDVIGRRLEEVGGEIERFYYCPHDVGDACDCRKPRPGLILRAAAELGLDVARSAMIGDSESDVEAGRAAGCATTILIAPHGTPTSADALAADLVEAAAVVGAPPCPDAAGPARM